MTSYLLRRLILMVPVILGVTIITFSLIYLVPGSPVDAIVGERASEAVRARVTEELGLNDPMITQYLKYMGRLLKGDLGKSYITNRSVSEQLMQRFPVTLKLTFYAFIISEIVGLITGILSAIKQNTRIDRLIRTVTLIGVSTPVMFSGLLLMYIFGVWLRVLPISGIGDGSIRYFIMPALVLGLSGAVYESRLARSSMLEVIRQDYIRTARAKGLSEFRVIFKHALRNAMIPIATSMIMRFGYMLTGSIIIETIFGLPGIGSFTVNAVFKRDIPVVMGCFLFQSIIFVVFNLLVDISYTIINPRIKYN